jgi:hypothetical protein
LENSSEWKCLCFNWQSQECEKSQALMDQACNLSYLKGWDWEDNGLRPAQARSSWESISKITTAKKTGSLAWVAENLLWKHEVQNQVPSKKKKKKVCEKTISRPGENICKSNILRTCIDKYINNPYKLIKRLCNYNMNEESE